MSQEALLTALFWLSVCFSKLIKGFFCSGWRNTVADMRLIFWYGDLESCCVISIHTHGLLLSFFVKAVLWFLVMWDHLAWRVSVAQLWTTAGVSGSQFFLYIFEHISRTLEYPPRKWNILCFTLRAYHTFLVSFPPRVVPAESHSDTSRLEGHNIRAWRNPNTLSHRMWNKAAAITWFLNKLQDVC